MRKTVFVFGVLSLFFVSQARAQDGAPLKTVTREAEPVNTKHEVDFLFQKDGKICRTTYVLRSSSKNIVQNAETGFSVRIKRTCSTHSPLPTKAVCNVRHINIKNSGVDYDIVPTGNGYSFTHSFKRTGKYRVTCTSELTPEEKYTVAMNVVVTAAP